jgi:hypothetical protein
VTGVDPAPPSRDTVPRSVGDRVAPLAAIALIALLLIVVFARQDEDKGPAVPQQVTPPPPTSFYELEGPVPSQGVIGQGTIVAGGTWSLSLDDPEPGLCLTVMGGGEAETSRACAGVPVAGSLLPQALYRPVTHDDPGGARFVFGSMPPGVAEVAPILADGGSSGRVPVAPGRGGPFYAVEVAGGSEPIAVFGYRRDGTSVRFDLPR